MGYKETQHLELLIARDKKSRPPCCVATHCSCVVDIGISPTFFDPREAPPCITHMTSFARADGHLALLPLSCATLYRSSGHREEASYGLAPCRLGLRGVSGSVDVLRGSAPVICCF